MAVSIPRSGFCLFIQCFILKQKRPNACFNPSVGILFVHTDCNSKKRFATTVVSIPRSGFCLFIREKPANRAYPRRVSIPRSGFCLFILRSFSLTVLALRVSIPRSGFCLFIPALLGDWGISQAMFQSLGRDSVCSYHPVIRFRAQEPVRFNPSVGILFVHTFHNLIK